MAHCASYNQRFHAWLFSLFPLTLSHSQSVPLFVSIPVAADKNKNSIGLRGIWGAQSQFRIYVARSTGTWKCRKQVDSRIRAHSQRHAGIHTLAHIERQHEQDTSCSGHSGHCGQVDCGWVFGISVNVASNRVASRCFALLCIACEWNLCGAIVTTIWST